MSLTSLITKSVEIKLQYKIHLIFQKIQNLKVFGFIMKNTVLKLFFLPKPKMVTRIQQQLDMLLPWNPNTDCSPLRLLLS